MLFCALAITALAGMLYLYTRLMKYGFIKSLGIKGKIIAWLAPSAITAIAVALLGISYFNFVIIFLHLILLWALADLGFFLYSKIFKKQIKYFFQGITAVVLTIAVLSVGWVLAHHVYRTDYSFTTEKELDNCRILQITDLHLGTTLDGEGFAKELKLIQAENPDILVITGDFVDDETKASDMVIACNALGDFKAKHGVYFIFGNHDKGYGDYRDFSSADLEYNLLKNNVTVLRDDVVLINDSFYLIGRCDKSDRSRKTMAELTQGLDKTKYTVVLDHQPNDYAAQAESGVDLVLSGHTHGGHIFPAGPLGVLIGANDSYYGASHIDNTDFLVSSGISGWAIAFKTGCISEYVVIDIKSE